MDICCNYINGFEVLEYNNSNVYVIRNILDNSFCNEMIDIINKVDLKKISYTDFNNVKCYTKTLEELISTDDNLNYVLSTDSVKYNKLLEETNNGNIYTNKLNCMSKSMLKQKYSEIFEKINIIKEITKKLKINFDFVSEIILRKIYGSTRTHTDSIFAINNFKNLNFVNKKCYKNNIYKSNPICIRKASIVFQLNDDYEGGLFNFPKYKISIPLEKGSAIIFPPYWTHIHGTDELINDTYRYTINTWLYETI